MIRSWIRIRTSDKWIRIRETQKYADPDPQLWLFASTGGLEIDIIFGFRSVQTMNLSQRNLNYPGMRDRQQFQVSIHKVV